MAISYEDWKSQYEWMSTDQQAKYAGMVKGNALAEEYANRYIKEKQDAGTFWQKTARSYTNANAPVNTPTQNTSSVSTPTRNETTPTTTVTPTPTTRQETPTVIGETRKETTRTETPVTTVSEIKQEWALTPLSKEYYSQTSDDAQTKIINNLNSYKASNPEYFTDYETFKRNFSYNARNDEQKNTLDTWYKWYSQGLQLSWTPIADLYTQYKNWSISTGDLESLRIANPTKYAELQAQINKWNIIAAYDDDNQTTETMFDQLRNSFLQNMITNLNASWSGASSIFDSYKDKMESPEMTELWDDAAKKQEEIEKVSADIDSMKKQVEKEYEGTWASRAKINAIVADRTYDLQLQLRSLNSEYNRIATQYNNRMNQYQNEFQLQLQEYQINMQERNQKMSELGFAMDLMNYETPQQQQEREWNYWVRQQEYTNWDINSKDYSTRYKAALKSVQNLLSQYQGIPMKRSAEQMAEDIIKNIDSNGTTLWQELSTINDFIKQKPEYKKLYNNTYWTWSWISKTYNIWGTEYVEYNWELLTSEDFNKRFWSKGKAKAYNQVDERAFSTSLMSTADWGDYYDGNTLWFFLAGNKYQNWKYFWECGKFVNDYLQFIWVTDAKNRYYDNDLSTKLNSVNEYTPKVWSIAVFDYNHKSSDGINHGHVGIVTKVNDDWSFEVRDSNFWSDGKVQTRTIKANDGALRWFFDPSQPSKNSTSNVLTNTTETPYQQERVWLYNAYIQNWTMPSDAKLKAIGKWDLAKWIDIFDSEVRSYIASNWIWNESKAARDEITNLRKEFDQQQTVKDYKNIKSSYSKMISSNDDTAAWDLSLIFSYMKLLDPGSVVREWEFANAQNAWWIDAKIINKYNQVRNGTRLTKKQRNDFINVAAKIMDSYTEEYNQLLEQYQSYVTQWGNVNKIWLMWEYVTQDYIARYNQEDNDVSGDTNSIWYIDIWLDNAVYNTQKFYSINK